MDEDRSGFRNIVLKPVMSGDLPYASASVRSIRGNVSSAWERTDQELRYAVEIPGNTLASLYIPKNAWNEVEVTEGENVCWDGKRRQGYGRPYIFAGRRKIYCLSDSGRDI